MSSKGPSSEPQAINESRRRFVYAAGGSGILLLAGGFAAGIARLFNEDEPAHSDQLRPSQTENKEDYKRIFPFTATEYNKKEAHTA